MAREKIKAAIITVSDKGAQGLREDRSGPVIAELIADAAEVVSMEILPDEREVIADALRRIADAETANVIFTTGGTGFSPRDVTPEATLDVIERETPGIPQTVLYKSLAVTGRAMLSRAVAGIRNRTLIVNLPGSPRAVEECLSALLPDLWHGVNVLTLVDRECARE